MKVVVTGTRGIPNIMGGIETHCEKLYPLVAKKGYDVAVIRRAQYAKDFFTEWNDVNLIDIASPRKKSLETLVHTFKAINRAKRLKANVLHIHAIGPGLLVPYAKLRGLKVVFTHHGPDYDREKWGFVAKTILKMGEFMACHFADEVIVISEVIKNIIAYKHGRTKNVHLIYNGVSTPDFVDYSSYFSELGIEEERYVLGMSRFVPEKNLHHLIHAFEVYKQRNPNSKVKLVLAGDTDFEDDYSRKLKQMARDNGVVLTGFVKGDKLHSLLTHASCYVLPSSHEGLPIALLEAMNYDLPVLVSSIPANREVGLTSDVYFEVGDVDRLSQLIEQRLQGTCGERISYDMTKYNWDNIADQVCDVYKKLEKE